MEKTKEILKRLDMDGTLLTKSDIAIILKEIKNSYLDILKFIETGMESRKAYTEFLKMNFGNYHIQSIVSYITYFEFKKDKLLSFDHLKGVYNIVRIYDMGKVQDIVYYIQLRAKTVVEHMYVYSIMEDDISKQESWDAAVIKSKSFNDYQEMYTNTVPGSEHALEAIILLIALAETNEERKLVKEFEKEQKNC